MKISSRLVFVQYIIINKYYIIIIIITNKMIG